MIKMIKNFIQKIISNPDTPIYFFEISRVLIGSIITTLFVIFIGIGIAETSSCFLIKKIFGESVLDKILGV